LVAAIGLLVGAAAASAEPADDEEPGYETVVTPSRSEEAAFESPRAIEVVGQRQLRERNPGATPEALQDETGVYMQRTNTAGGAPILRGLMGQHVLLLVDGIRLNNAITRFGPNQLLNTVDPFQIQRVELVRGPGSVLYGSDAMGGVVNLITRRPAFDPRRAWDASAELLGRYDSADSGLQGHLGLSGHIRGLGARAGGSFKHFGELDGGRDTGTQRFTAYQEGDANLSLAWALSSSSMLRASYAAVRQKDAFRTDRSTPTDFLRFTDQFRDLASIGYSGRFDDFFIRQADITLSFHSQRELRERFRLALDRIEWEEDQVSTAGAMVNLRTDLPYNRLTYGVDVYHDWIASAAQSGAVSSAEWTLLDRGRYVDGSAYTQLGVYLMDRIPLWRKLAFDVGARVSTWSIQIPEDLHAKIDEIQTTRTSFVGSFHARYLVGDGLNFVAGVSQGYRAPNVDDFSALGCSGQGYDVPQKDLASEKSITAEAGVKLDLFGMLTGSVFYYFTHLNDLIVRMPGTLMTSAGPTSRVQCGTAADGQPIMVGVYTRDNAETGQIHGVEASAQLSLGHWALFSWVTWTRGEVTLDLPGSYSEPMSRIPPLNGLAGVRYDVSGGVGFAELAVRWADRQDRLSTSDRGDRRICPAGTTACDGTPGYAVLTLRGGARVHRFLRLTAALENLTNTTYRIHGSGIDGAGVSGILGMELLVQ
jgi:outer membrane receptor protein involved in Fe transport